MAGQVRKIDYSPLSQPVTEADVAAYRQYQYASPAGVQANNSKKANNVLYVVLGFFALVIVVFSLLGLFLDGNPGGILWIIVAGVMAWGIYMFTVADTKRLAKLYKFAVKNNIVLKLGVLNHELDGIIFHLGRDKKISEAYRFDNGSEIGNYQYTTGSGKNQTTTEWGYVRVPLARSLPNMVLDAKSNNLMGSISNLPVSLGKNTKLKLEGDFNNYFDLYVPSEYERDALYIFTPDVMQALVDSGASYDMEVIDNSLMIYRRLRFDLTSAVELAQTFSIVNLLADEVRDQSNYYADERVASRADNRVSEPGKRLKSGVGKTAGIIAAVLFIIIFSFQVFPVISTVIEIFWGRN